MDFVRLKAVAEGTNLAGKKPLMVNRSDLSSQVRLASGVNVLLGLLLCAAPWLFGDSSAYRLLTLNSTVTGALVIVCAGLRLRHGRGGPRLGSRGLSAQRAEPEARAE